MLNRSWISESSVCWTGRRKNHFKECPMHKFSKWKSQSKQGKRQNGLGKKGATKNKTTVEKESSDSTQKPHRHTKNSKPGTVVVKKQHRTNERTNDRVLCMCSLTRSTKWNSAEATKWENSTQGTNNTNKTTATTNWIYINRHIDTESKRMN